MDRSFQQLLVLFETGQLTGNELDHFFELLEVEDNRALLAAAIDEKAMQENQLPAEQTVLTERAVASLKEAMQRLPEETPVRPLRKFIYWGWAAAALLIITAAWYLIAKNHEGPPATRNLPVASHDITAPQTNRAMITLANGQRIYLDSSANGLLSQQGAARLVKTADGQIHYQQQGAPEGQTLFNTLYNPRGSRIINIELTDGTKVWLNAGSSLSYPVSFTGNERKVSITGEAYFEVAHNPSKPFIVSKGSMTVQVLGTHFNINAYDDEAAIKTTLLEGKVEISAIGNPQSAMDNIRKVILKPGEQAVMATDSRLPTADSRLTIDHSPDLEQVMAWKNGRFVFGDKVDVATIMRQVARWYDLEVELRGNFTQHFGGSISREASAAEVFKVLEATGGLHCQVSGRKVIVTQG